MRGRYRVGVLVALSLLSGAITAGAHVSAEGATLHADSAVLPRAPGMARLVDASRYPSPGVVVDLVAKRVYCVGQLVLQVRTDSGWEDLKSKATSGCFDVVNRVGEVGTIYGMKVRSPRAAAGRDKYRVVSTATGQPRRVSDTLVVRSTGATLSGRVTKRATGQHIDLLHRFPFIMVTPWLKTPHGWRQRDTNGFLTPTGSFRLLDLKPGRYKLQVQVRKEGTGLAEQWFGDVDSSSVARVMRLAPGARHRNVDVSLPPGRDVWFAVAGRTPACVGVDLYPPGETLPYLEAGGPQPDFAVQEIPGLPLTSYKLKLGFCAHSRASRHHWLPTWYVRSRTRKAATSFTITSSTASSRAHPLLSVRMLHR